MAINTIMIMKKLNFMIHCYIKDNIKDNEFKLLTNVNC